VETCGTRSQQAGTRRSAPAASPDPQRRHAAPSPVLPGRARVQTTALQKCVVVPRRARMSSSSPVLARFQGLGMRFQGLGCRPPPIAHTRYSVAAHVFGVEGVG
jgi:hypothetical protein